MGNLNSNRACILTIDSFAQSTIRNHHTSHPDPRAIHYILTNRELTLYVITKHLPGSIRTPARILPVADDLVS
jgi:hypothetical protein